MIIFRSKEKARIAAGFLFLVPARATTEAERNARATISIASAIVGSAAVSPTIVGTGRVIAVAVTVVRTIATMSVVTIMPTLRADIGRLLGYAG